MPLADYAGGSAPLAHHDCAAWLCDLDGTLYRAQPVRMAMACELLIGGWKALPVLRAMRQELERLRASDEAYDESPFLRQITNVARRTTRDAREVAECVERWMIARPGRWLRWFARHSLLARIRAYRAAGGRVALVSDYPARGKLEAMGLSELFEVVIASGEPDGPRRLKPWPDGYLLAAERLQVHPARCLVIGDRDDADGRAAANAGMRFMRV